MDDISSWTSEILMIKTSQYNPVESIQINLHLKNIEVLINIVFIDELVWCFPQWFRAPQYILQLI